MGKSLQPPEQLEPTTSSAPDSAQSLGPASGAQNLIGNAAIRDGLIGAGIGGALFGPLGAIGGGLIGGWIGSQSDQAPTQSPTQTPTQPQAPGPAPLARDDTEGQRDREAAARELAGNFQIVDEHATGQRLPNQVTQAEFDQIAATYSDIRRGRTDLQLDAAMSADQRNATMGDLGHILQTSSGREMLNTLAYAPNPTSGNHPTTTLHALTNPLGIGAAGFRSPGASNGQGANSDVNYAPGQTVNIPGSTDAWNPYRSDVAVFHELTHAYHNHQGDNVLTAEGEDMAAGTGAHTGDRISENRYRAERRAMGENVPNRDHY